MQIAAIYHVRKGRLVIGVMVFDDTRLFRDGLANTLDAQAGIRVVDVASHTGELLHRVHASQPDMILVRMGIQGCIDIVKTIAQTAPAVKVIMLGVTESEDEVIACAEAGAAGYLPRSGSLGDLLDVMRSVSLGETLCSPRVAAALLKRIATLAAAAEHLQEQPFLDNLRSLTIREREVLDLVDQRLSNKEIAQRLSIDVRTVKNHVHNILQKLQVHRRSDAARRIRKAEASLAVPSR